MTYEVLHGDCRTLMADMEGCSVDSIVTDPPYELTSARPGGRSPATQGKVMKGFMGMEWDGSGVAFDPETWAAALRVLKPGGWLVAFGGSRTYHRMACAIEDAGFEIRDQIMWIYGSGFPKGGLDDEGRGTCLKPAHEPIVLARKPLVGSAVANVAAFGTGKLNIDAARNGESGARNNGRQAGTNGIYGHIGATTPVDYGKGRWPANIVHDGSDEVLASFPAAPGQIADASASSAPRRDQNVYGALRAGRGEEASADSANAGAVGFQMRPGARRLDSGSAARFFYCAKASKADRDTGLQYHELIRIEATWEDVALNLRLRVDTAQSPPRVIGAFGMPNSDVTAWNTWLFGSEPMGRSLQGCKFTTATRTSSTTDSKTWNCLVRWFTSASIAAVSFVTESGGSHAANAENCDTSAIITNGSTAYLPGVSPAPSGTLFKISVTAGRSDHPTVKPEALMRWLVRLITPPGGLVLDPFTGSGSTGKAAVLEGFDFVGCELTPEYLPIANARIAAAVARAEQAQAAAPQYDMFDGAAA